MTKVCSKCKQEKDVSMYGKEKGGKDGYRAECKECKKANRSARDKTKRGCILVSYNNQKVNSKRRGDNPPSYSLEELIEWMQDNAEFHIMYNTWVNSGYMKDLKPSIDRINDYRGYSLDNIQLTTWGENNARFWNDTKTGINTKKCKPIRSIDTITGDIVEYHSLSNALRLGVKGCLYSALYRSALTEKRYKWEFI